MADEEERLQAILAALVKRRLEESLVHVERALAAWRQGEADVYVAHAEALRHAARANALSARIARAGVEGPAPLLRDAYDAGLLDRAGFVALAGVSPEEIPAPGSLEEDGAAPAGPPLPDKRQVLEKLLDDGPVLLHLDARTPGVVVPAGLKNEHRLVLRVGYALTPPIPDLEIGDAGVAATLSFNRQPHRCEVPWDALFAIVAEDGRGLVWPEDVPPEAARDFAPRGRPGGGPSGVPDDGPPDDGPPEPTPPRRGHLKLVT